MYKYNIWENIAHNTSAGKLDFKAFPILLQGSSIYIMYTSVATVRRDI